MNKIKTIGDLRDYLNDLIECHGENLPIRRRGFFNPDYEDCPPAVELSDKDFTMMFLRDRRAQFRDDQLLKTPRTDADKKVLVID